MFKHRLSKFGRLSLLAACLLFVGGSLQSCKDMLDDYKYDDTEPDWLGESIYAFLEKGTEKHTYKNYIELIDSLGEKETLNHTGSKTLFIADDEAFARFFNEGNNIWGVKSVADMSKAQMKTILYSSMLDNAMLLDMMASTGSSAAEEGKCLRRNTSNDVLNDVPLVDGGSFALHPKWPTYNEYWDALRDSTRTEKLHLLADGTQPMMVHFLSDFVRTNNLEVSDINFLFKKNGASSKEYKEGDAFVFGNKVVDGDVDNGEYSDDVMTITCKNGYLYRLDNVLIPPTNMAGELRKCEDTKIFSHLLDRFCVPVYNGGLSADYKEIYKSSDSIFTLRYFSKGDFTSETRLGVLSKNPLPDELLNYDPGKNEYAGGVGKKEDMAAMFVPKDKFVYEYFATGGGNFLLEHYAKSVNYEPTYDPENVPALLQALDSVPQVNIAAFLNNLMKTSFVNSVPSRFSKVTNDANDDMGIKEEHVDECLIANNGVIYLLNKVFSPAAYAAVTAPTLIHDNLSIMRNVVKQLRYDYYLLAMDAQYSFIIPENDHFVYYDPITFVNPAKTQRMAYSFHYDNKRPDNKKKSNVELWADQYVVNKETLLVDSTEVEFGPVGVDGTGFNGDAFMKNRMTDLLDYLIIVHEKGETLSPERKYYSTKGYGTVRVDVDPADPNNIKFRGGEQLETGTYVALSKIDEKENGFSYMTTIPEEYIELDGNSGAGGEEVGGEAEGENGNGESGETVKRTEGESGNESETSKKVDENFGKRFYSAIPTPPRKSVYENMKAQGTADGDLYHNFFNLCTFDDGEGNVFGLEAALKTMFNLKDTKVIKDSIKYYSIFYSYDTDEKSSNTVPFFSTYHYTVYVPSNEAINEMHQQGLPTWGDVNDALSKEPGKAASMMRQLNGFVRYHFQDNSVYYDICKHSVSMPGGGKDERPSYATGVIDEETGRFYENIVYSDENNTTILIQDNKGNTAKIVNTPAENENVTWNVMCRDIIWNGNNIATSSFSVIQPIDIALQNKGMFGYDSRFKRFAVTGELVDTLSVDGGEGGYASSYGGDGCYLVAKCGEIAVEHAGKTYNCNAAYLMQPLDEAEWTSIKRETLVMVNEKPVQVTSDGYLLKVVPAKEKDEDDTIAFDTVKEDGVVYLQKVKNNGELIKKVKFDDVFKPVTGDNNSDVE